MIFRNFLDLIEQNGELLKITKEVSPKFEVSAIIEKVQKTTNKAVLFENVKGYPNYRVASNFLGKYSRLAMAFNLDYLENQVISKLSKKWGLISPIKASSKKVRDVFIENFDLKKLIPTVHHYEKDVGPYITGGIIVAKDPETSERNLSYHRLQIKEKNELGLRITPGHHLGIYFDKAEKLGESLEIAVLIGNSPAIMLAASTNLPLSWDELEFAGSLQVGPVELISCETVGLRAPIDTEIIIEGEILPGVRKPEGPFGDLLGNYTPVMNNHVIKVRAITLKESPIHYTILPGNVEDIILLGVPIATSIFKEIKKVIPTIKDVVCWPSLFNCVIQIDKISEGQGKQAALAAFGTNMQWMKFCTVVDSDVNIYDPSDVSWATASRCSPERDVIIIPSIPGFRRDPYKMQWGRVIIDATAPLSLKAEFERKKIPGVDKIEVEEYL